MTETCSAVLRSRQNCSNDGAERTDDGRAFHALAAVTEKAQSPSVVRRVVGMTTVNWEALRRRRREPTSTAEWRVSARYDGAVPIRCWRRAMSEVWMQQTRVKATVTAIGNKKTEYSNTPHGYGNSCNTWDHTVLPAARQSWHSHPYPSRSGTRFSDPVGMQGWVYLVGWLHTEMVYPPKDGHPSREQFQWFQTEMRGLLDSQLYTAYQHLLLVLPPNDYRPLWLRWQARVVGLPPIPDFLGCPRFVPCCPASQQDTKCSGYQGKVIMAKMIIRTIVTIGLVQYTQRYLLSLVSYRYLLS